MLTHERTDEGFVIQRGDGRTVCRLHTHETQQGEILEKGRIVSHPTQVELEKPYVHFTGIRLSPDELPEIVTRIQKLIGLDA